MVGRGEVTKIITAARRVQANADVLISPCSRREVLAVEPKPDDKLVAAVAARGLSLGAVRREDVVRWADRRIAEIDVPPAWLVDLSLSQDRHRLDLIGDLNRLGDGVDPVAVCRAIYALLPDVGGRSFDRVARVAKQVYRTTYECLGGDWSQPLLSVTDNLADAFDFLRDGYLNSTEQAVAGAVERFAEEHRNGAIVGLLRPIAWSWEPERRPEPVAGEVGPIVHIGLSAWIVQDGNYGDFSVRQQARFALEFYPPDGLRPVRAGPLMAEYLHGGRYQVQATVVFATAEVWVIDAGLFKAFRESPPPDHAVVGSWVEGEVYVGIDPFFYFEYLFRQEEMPPLTYTWRVRRIERETTPWVETRNDRGQVCRSRDDALRSFVPARETRAWTDDDGSAHYVLACERIGGPERPSGP